MVELTWLGHGTFQLRLETGEVVLLDPGWMAILPTRRRTRSTGWTRC